MKIKIDKHSTGEVSYWLWCPGCDETHLINQTWTFDGNIENPTFSPSILVTNGHYAPQYNGEGCWCTFGDKSNFKCGRCHSFIRNGQWEFLSASTHALSGQTVPMVDLPDGLEGQ